MRINPQTIKSFTKVAGFSSILERTPIKPVDFSKVKVFKLHNNFANYKSSEKNPFQLFHITTKKGWFIIKNEGKIKPYQDELSNIKGIFCIDMKDFVENWTAGSHNFANELLRTIRRKRDDFVLLKVNVNKSIIDNNNLKIRKLQEMLKGNLEARPIKDVVKTKQLEYIITDELPINNVEYVSTKSDYDFNDLIGDNLKYHSKKANVNIVRDFMKLLQEK